MTTPIVEGERELMYGKWSWRETLKRVWAWLRSKVGRQPTKVYREMNYGITDEDLTEPENTKFISPGFFPIIRLTLNPLSTS